MAFLRLDWVPVVGLLFGDERYNLDFPIYGCVLRYVSLSYRSFNRNLKDISVNNQNELFLRA